MIILKLTVTKDLTRLEGPNDCCYAPTNNFIFSLNQLPATEKNDKYFWSIPINPSCFVRALIGIYIVST